MPPIPVVLAAPTSSFRNQGTDSSMQTMQIMRWTVPNGAAIVKSSLGRHYPWWSERRGATHEIRTTFLPAFGPGLPAYCWEQ
jgi:hypothetical protein